MTVKIAERLRATVDALKASDARTHKHLNQSAEMAAAVVAAWETDLIEAVIHVCNTYDCSLAELRAQLAAFEQEALS